MNNLRKLSSRPAARWPVAVYVALLACAIPWYWPSENLRLIFGFPAWVCIAIAVSFVASVFTAWLLRKPWPGETEGLELKRDE